MNSPDICDKSYLQNSHELTENAIEDRCTRIWWNLVKHFKGKCKSEMYSIEIILCI